MSGRPGQAIGGAVVGTGILQIQSGYDYDVDDMTQTRSTIQTLNNVLRLGLSENFEVSTVVDYSLVKNSFPGHQASIEGLSQWQMGFRYNVIPEDKDWIPVLGIQTRFRMKQVSHHFKINQVAPVIMVSAQKGLTEDFSFTANGGVDYNGSDNVPTYNWVLSLSQALTSQIGLTYEVYGNQYNDQNRQYLGIGLAWLLNSNFQLDTYVSTAKNQNAEELYATLGFSWRTWVL